MRPLFSVLHSSARPQAWRKVYDAWIAAASDPSQVEYVLCVDSRWGFIRDGLWFYDWEANRPQRNRVVWNEGRRCCVDGVNAAACAATGRILIVVADDQFPCPQWDLELQRVVGDLRFEGQLFNPLADPLVVEVSTGTPNEHERGIMVMPILSRAWYEKKGGRVFFPAYESMFADNDFCEHARQESIVTDARHLMFPHRHAMFDGQGGWNPNAQLDEAYKAQMRREAFVVGEAVLKMRRARGFEHERSVKALCEIEKYDGADGTAGEPQTGGKVVALPSQPASMKQSPDRSIALCLSGEHFRGEWLDGALDLWAHLFQSGFTVIRTRQYTSNVYVTREEVRKLIASLNPHPDLLLWLDDDNVCTPAQFDRLLADLDARPDLDGVTAWCWIHDDDKKRFMPSCGLWAPDHLRWQPFDPRDLRGAELKSIDATGFPCFLMRYAAIEKAGDGAFLPILDKRLEHGMAGEDIAFCVAAEKGGARFAVDPQVRVAHLKYVTVEPVFEGEGLAPLKIAAMLRVRNEGRWIARVIESLKPLAGENIFVLDDESTDRTPFLAYDAGAQVFSDPFPGQPLDEVRDKTWLTEKVKAACDPDWILMIDGDEELEPGGAEKIKRALSLNPPEDCFGLRVLYLWNQVDTIRVDGHYQAMARQSLFRPLEGVGFQSFYAGDADPKCHVGLHCSNAPRGLKEGVLNACLLHYGYLLREDRIRKYEWYNRVDPNNEHEDCYRHVVQGDIPEVPAMAALKHCGPLELRKLPRHLVPDFTLAQSPEVPPGSYEPVRLKLNEQYMSIDADPRRATPEGLKLNLGCCDRRIPGYVGVDIAPGAGVDVVADLRQQWPWERETVSAVLAHDVIEHLPNKIWTMNELYRVLTPGGCVEIVVPTTEGPGAFQDPTHVSFWNRRSFGYFERGNPYRERFAQSYGIAASFRVVSERIDQTQDGPKLTIILQKPLAHGQEKEVAERVQSRGGLVPAPEKRRDLEVCLL